MTVVGGQTRPSGLSARIRRRRCRAPRGLIFAPLTSPGAVTVTATSAADSSQSATASVTIGSSTGSNGPLSSILPTMAQEGLGAARHLSEWYKFLLYQHSACRRRSGPHDIHQALRSCAPTIPAALLVSPAPCTPQTGSAANSDYSGAPEWPIVRSRRI